MRILRRAFRRGALPTGQCDEHGYVMVVTAIVLPLVLVFTAFTIDFGSWYSRAAQLKRGADAAALAGVVWMPDFPTAKTHALEAAQRNGFQDGVNNITVSVNQVPGHDQQLSVTITDSKVDQIFSKLVLNGLSISRSSTAEYVLPVPMGSPKNVFGTGNLIPGTVPGADRENFWAAVNGYCAGHESGDKKLAKYETYSVLIGSNSRCEPTGTNDGVAGRAFNNSFNPDYDANGYLYAIDLPHDVATLKLDVYDGGYYMKKNSPTWTEPGWTDSPSDSSFVTFNPGDTTSVQGVTTIFDLYELNTTPLDLSNLTPTAVNPHITINGNTSQATYQNKWANLHTWNNAKAGQYYVRVRTLGPQTNSRGSNGFGLHAYTDSMPSPYSGSPPTNPSTCTTIPGPGYLDSCPQIRAVTDMSIYANLTGTAADFYLAQVNPVHAGKTMRITLFDPGEGASQLQIIDPNGDPVGADFSWSTQCSPPTPPSGGVCSSGGLVKSLDVSGGSGIPGDPKLTQPYPGLWSGARYNDRALTVDVKLPNDFSVYSGKTWWKVRYTVGTTPTDRTTWSVNIVGDPVHLVG